jgi:hypothetical protein
MSNNLVMLICGGVAAVLVFVPVLRKLLLIALAVLAVVVVFVPDLLHYLPVAGGAR